ncbi:hypothetical protein Tco_1576117 [Tanacetum coccineum]
MENENHVRTLGDYSRPSHEGYRYTIELLDRNNVVPLRSDTIPLVQNKCSFHGLRMDSFQGLTPKSPSSWHRPFAPSPNLYDHVNPATRRTIDQAADEDESREAGAIETDATKDDDRNIVFEEKEKVKEGLGGSKPKFEEGELRDIKRNDLDDGMCEETKEKERSQRRKLRKN